MIGQSIIPIVIDTDNASGSAKNIFFGGDVDDAYALAFLLKNKTSVSAIYSVDGNASSENCYRNNLEICRILQSNVPCFKGSPYLQIPENSCHYLALGPLTNLARFLKSGFKPESIWMTLGRNKTFGDYPPFWPMEFNATKDIEAFQTVLHSNIKKVIVPLDRAFELRIQRHHKAQLQSSEVGRYLWTHSQRWFWRSLFLKGRSSFPVWDLVSAIAIAYPDCVQMQKGRGYFFKNGLFICDVQDQKRTYHQRHKAIFSCDIEIVEKIDVELIWSVFFKVLQGP